MTPRPLRFLAILSAIPALVGCLALLRRVAARSNTQVHRINQR